MIWTLIWQAVGIVVIGTLLLRISGRRSIAQMSFSQVVLMVGIGTLLIQPISGHGYWITLILAAVLVISTIVMEFFEIKSDMFEKVITGQAVIVIKNGQLNYEQLKKNRLSADKLEMRLRQAGISKISDVEFATLEPSGNLGYQLKPEKQPATKEDIQKLIDYLETKVTTDILKSISKHTVFSEITGGHTTPPPKKLQ